MEKSKPILKQIFTIILFLSISIVISSCEEKHSLCKDFSLVEKYNKGRLIDGKKLEVAIINLENGTNVECKKDGSLIGILYYPDKQTMQQWKESLKKKGIDCD